MLDLLQGDLLLDMDTIKNTKQYYNLPLDGYYYINMACSVSRPTGEYELVDDEKRKWYQFWKPKKILKEKYIFEKIIDGASTQYIKKDHKLEFQVQRIGS